MYIKKLKDLLNEKNRLEFLLKKQNLKVGDKVHYMYNKPFLGYKLKSGIIVEKDINFFGATYDYRILLENGKKVCADNSEVELYDLKKDYTFNQEVFYKSEKNSFRSDKLYFKEYDENTDKVLVANAKSVRFHNYDDWWLDAKDISCV